MKNKPVAWMMKSNDPDYVSDYIMFKTPERKDKISHQAVPLYTHPHPDNLGLAESIIKQQELQIKALKAVLEQEGIGVGRDLLNGGIALFRKAQENE